MNQLHNSPTTREVTLKNTSLVALAFAFLTLFGLVSCVTTQSTQTTSQPEQTKQPEQVQQADQPPSVTKMDKKYDTLFFSAFTIKPELAKNYPAAARTLQQSMMTALQAEKIFKKVATAAEGTPTDSKTLLVKAEITNMRIVSDSARFWGGAFAGSSGVELTLQLIDGGTNAVVREEKMSSWNNAWAASWSFGSTDHSLVDDMGKISAKYVIAAMPEK